LYGEAYIQSVLGVDTKLLVDAELGGEGRRPVRNFPLSKLRKRRRSPSYTIGMRHPPTI
jgi:hypothetical protein